MRQITPFSILSVLLLACGPTLVSAQDKLPTDEYGKLLHETESVKAVDSGMFGEDVSLYNGATSFSAIDLSIPGNNALTVAVGRRLAAEERSGHLGGFGDWSLDVPYLTGKVSQAYGWTSDTGATTRCSVPATPRGTTGFPASLFWQGWSMSIPGAGTQQMLQSLSTTPPGPGGVVTPYLTKQRWYFTACPLITDGSASGEGFEVTAPDGTRYTFAHMINRVTDSIIDAGYWSGGVPYAKNRMTRYNAYLVVTQVRDRFDNTVTYNWSGDKLISISASDGRSITLTWVGSSISSVSGGGRTVSYGYTTDSYTYKNGLLSTVTLGDGSQWRYATSWATPTDKPFYIKHDIDPPPISTYSGCMFDFAGGATTFSVTHPSGATGVFQFQSVRHVRSYVPKVCLPTTGTAGRYKYPPFSDVMSLVSRTVTGPGISAPEVRTYTYTMQPPQFAWGTNCTDTTGLACSGTKLTTVVDPNGTQAVYTFGSWFGVNEGQQLKLVIGPDTAPLKTITQAYVQNEEVANYPFADRMGSSMINAGDNFNAELVRPQKSTATTIDGATFARDISSFDLYANPTCAYQYTTGSSATGSPMSRYERTTYESNTTLWVLSQVKKVERVPDCSAGALAIGNAIVENTYDPANANLLSYSRFGIVQQSYTYNGYLLATVTEPGKPAATLNNYANGVPKNITLPDTRTMSATLDSMGLPLSVTDQNGYATGYTYDAVGRLKNTTYPTGDSTAWNPTLRSLTCATAAILGLDANHCEYSSSTGNARTTTYFDAHLRPVVVLTEIVGDTTTRSYLVKRYDAVGRESFVSYPLATLTDFNATTLKGTHTQYDAIGRPVQVSQDSELGALLTTTDYLPGFVTRVTNPRGYQSTIEYQDFDEPQTDAPTRIVNGVGLSEQQVTTITRDVFGKPLTITRSGN